MKRILFAFILSLFFTSYSNGAGSDFYVIPIPAGVGTKISSTPFTITKPGFYYLTKNLQATGTGIFIDADNVTLDLMGFVLEGPGSGSDHGIEIGCQSNTEIRNGIVAHFGGNGIDGTCVSMRTRINNMRLVANGRNGVYLAGSDHYLANCSAQVNTEDGYRLLGDGMMVGNEALDNGDDGMQVAEGSILNNSLSGNNGYGFRASTSTSDRYLFDGNWVEENVSGGMNVTPPSAVFGVNAGIP